MAVPISARIAHAAVKLMPGISVRRLTAAAKGGSQLPDAGVERGEVGVDRIDPGQHPLQQERMVAGEVASERLLQHGDLAAHHAPGQLGQRRIVGELEGTTHREARDAWLNREGITFLPDEVLAAD
jgi:hypothetical protein